MQFWRWLKKRFCHQAIKTNYVVFKIKPKSEKSIILLYYLKILQGASLVLPNIWISDQKLLPHPQNIPPSPSNPLNGTKQPGGEEWKEWLYLCIGRLEDKEWVPVCQLGY